MMKSTTNTFTIKVSATTNSPFSALNDFVVYSGGYFIDPLLYPSSFLFQETLYGLPYSVTSYTGKTKSVFDREINPQSLFFGNSGYSIYVVGNVSDKVHTYNLSLSWDISTAYYSKSLNLNPSLENSPTGVFFKPDGLKMYIIGDNKNAVMQYNLTIPWDTSTSTYTSQFPILFESGSKGLFISPNGTNLYVTGVSSKKIHQYALSTPWDISTGTYPLKEFSVQSEESLPSDLFFKPDGSECFVTGLEKYRIFEYKLLTPWDITTAYYTNISFAISAQDNRPVGMFFKPEGDRFYILGSQYDNIYQYSIPASQVWNLSGGIPTVTSLSGGNFKTTYNDLKNIKHVNIGHYVFCDSNVIFDFSDFDQSKSKIIKLTFNPDNGNDIQTFTSQLSNNDILYPNLSSIQSIYYPSELYNTFYHPNFQIYYEDGNYINLTVPLTVFQCGIYETYKHKKVLDSLPYYGNSNNVLLFINDDSDNSLFIGDINTKLPFVLSANVPSKDVELPFLLELVPQQSTLESIDPYIPEPPINENPIYLDTGFYIYGEYRGISINPNYVRFYEKENFVTPNNGLTISSGGAPYFAGSGITIEVIQLD